MDELIKLVTQKTGLSPELARKAAETVLGFVKAKLPPAVASQIDSLIAGESPGGLGGLAGGLGDLLGKK